MIHVTRWLTALVGSLAVTAAAYAADNSWIEQSNRNAQILLEINARYNPETATSVGVEGYDKDVVDLKPRFQQRQETELAAAEKKLRDLRETESDTRVRQDLDILIKAAQQQQRNSELNRKYLLTFLDLPQVMFSGFQNLIDPRVPKERQKDAIVRLHRYVGAEKGYQPLTTLAEQRYAEDAANPALLGPWIVEAQQYLD